MSAIDISRYQGAVDFNAVKAAGVSVVIAKVGGDDAGEYVDANWPANRDGIRAAGLKLGSYFFNGPGSSPTQAADFHFGNADWRPGDLLVIDVEGGAIAWSVSQVIEWVDRIIAHGVPASSVGVYMSASVVRAYDWSPVADRGTFLWVASYGANTGQPGTPPQILHWPAWSLWQYTSNGSIPGVPGRCDVSQLAPEFSGGNITPLLPDEETMSVLYVVGNGDQTVWALHRDTLTRHAVTGNEWRVVGLNQDATPIKVIGVDPTWLATWQIVTVPPAASSGVDVAALATALAPLLPGVDVGALETHIDTALAQVQATLRTGFTVTSTLASGK